MKRGVGIAVSGFGVWCASLVSAHDPINTKITWDREISAIVERRCVSCHAPGGFGTFPLTTYDEARPWAVAIKELTLAGEMPPWGAAPGVGHFANDRRLTRHELEVIAAWVDGGAPRTLPAPNPRLPTSNSQPPTADRQPPTASGAAGTVVPLASAVITEATDRAASATLQLPAGLVLTRWTFEPGSPAIIERVDLELGPRWLGTWTPGDQSIDFPADAGMPLPASALFTARIAYRSPGERTIDYSRLRIWMDKEARPRSLREGSVVRSWRTTEPVAIVAVRPAREDGAIDVVARFANGRVEPIAAIAPPGRAPHPTYFLARPLALPAGARVETTGPVRLLYTTGATRSVNPNVSTRPPR